MKKAPILRILPIAFLLLLYISQWWSVQFADGARCILYGFPLVYTAAGHSGVPTTEVYAMELLVDYLFYVAALYLVYRLFKPYFERLVLPRVTTMILWTVVALHFMFYIWTIAVPGKLVVFGKIPYVISYMLDKGFAFFWLAPSP